MTSAVSHDARVVEWAGGGDGLIITGLAHSGKTQVRRILETSNQIFGARRSPYWTDRRYWRAHDRNPNSTALVADLATKTAMADWKTDVVRVAADLTSIARPAYPNLLALLHRSEAAERGQEMWCVQARGMEPFIHRYLTELPQVRIVHTVRDPRHASTGPRDQTPITRQGRDLARWERSASAALEYRKKFADRYLVISWEELNLDPDAVAARLSTFTGHELSVPPSHLQGTASLNGGGSSSQWGVHLVAETLEDLGYPRPTRPSGVRVRDRIEIAAFHSYRRLLENLPETRRS